MNALKKLHAEISNFVLDAIENDSKVHEVWLTRN